jgi:hypothetical protein
MPIDPEKIRAGLAARRAAAEASAAEEPTAVGPQASQPVASPGRAGKEQIVRGAVGFAGSVLDAGQYVGQDLYAKKQAMARRLGFNAPDPEPIAGPSYHETFTNATGIGPPTDFWGGVGEQVGGSLPMSLATGGMAPAGQVVRAIGTNLIQDVAGSVAGQFAKKQGAGPIGQAAASILAAIMVPTRLIQEGAESVAGRARGIQTAAAARDEAISGAQKVASTPAIRELSDSETLKLSKELGMKPDNVRAVSAYLRDRIAIDPTTGQPKIDEFMQTLDEADRLFKGGVTPPLANVVGDVGGENILAVQKSVLESDAIANSRATGIHQAVTKDLDARMDKLFPRWDTDSALSDFSTLEESRSLQKAAAWDAVPFDEIPTRPSAPIKAVLADIQKRDGLAYAKMPSTTRNFIEKMGDEASLRDLQSLKADLANTIEAARNNPDPDFKTIKQASMRVLDVVKSETQKLPSTGTAKYNEAVKSTREYYELFDPEFKTVRAFTRFEDREKIVREVFKADRPAEEVDNLRRVFGQTEKGMEKVESIFMRDLVGENLGDKPVGSVLKELTKESKESFYKKLLGPEKYRDTVDVLNGYRIGTSYGAGSASALMKTGSKEPSIKRLAGILSNPISTVKGIPVVISETMDSIDAQERVKLIEEMIFDPTGIARKLAKLPLESSKPQEVETWLQNFSILVARSRTRKALEEMERAQGGMYPSSAQAAGRQAISSAVVNQPLPPQGNGGGVR